MTNEQETESSIEIPAESLKPEILTAIIEEFILREGTDYGAVEVSHPAKIRQVQTQIQRGDVKVVFDQTTESVTLMTKQQLARRQAHGE